MIANKDFGSAYELSCFRLFHRKMLWLFIFAFVLPGCMSALTDKLTNLTQITWYNGVNSQAKLQKAFASE